MRPSKDNKGSIWVLLAWGLNGLGILALLVILVFYLSGNSVQAALDPPVSTLPPRPTRTPAPTSFYLPTVTPNPQATEIEDYSTPTPFIFSSSDSVSHLIGYSVQNRPIEAYSFGQGESQYLIVAGIHGGYEGNTVDLANKLLVYISQNPGVIPSGSTLYIIPDMNPDAVARGRNVDARVNANGVDLNRNFPTSNWTANWDHTNCWNDRPTTGGTSRGSEP